MNIHTLFDTFFQGQALDTLLQGIDLALEEDGLDLTSEAIFSLEETLRATVVAKASGIIAGLPLIGLILEGAGPSGHEAEIDLVVDEGNRVGPGQEICHLQGSAILLLKAERVILNYLTHLSGIATMTDSFVQALHGSRTQLLDTRKTLPGLRYPEKYAVRIGGGQNHRLNLAQMLMLKDNHIDQAGSIPAAVTKLRAKYHPCPPIEVECRTRDQVHEAVAAGVERIMLDNMDQEGIADCLELIPAGIESEISGGVSLDNLPKLGALGADFISVGCLTNSAPVLDLSMRLRLDPDSGGL
ncbi:MAG: carboxylating nicotinate-nucleotide diphosphorylase [Desulfovermiculus sp.]|nr:carboxylating nicotinate-nucleotide diphosphorylase [Desulfovermiculus sp.]